MSGFNPRSGKQLGKGGRGRGGGGGKKNNFKVRRVLLVKL